MQDLAFIAQDLGRTNAAKVATTHGYVVACSHGGQCFTQHQQLIVVKVDDTLSSCTLPIHVTCDACSYRGVPTIPICSSSETLSALSVYSRLWLT